MPYREDYIAQIREYGRLSIRDRLQWLEDAAKFNEMVFTPEEKRLRERMKNLPKKRDESEASDEVTAYQ